MTIHSARRHLAPALLALAGAALALAQTPSAKPASTPPASSPSASGGGGGAGTAAKLPAIEIEKLVAPVALYPDVLLAQILPASTFPVDIVKAARWLRDKPDMSKLLQQEWDVSVLSLCHYPDVIYMLDKDLDWTSSLGAAFLDQQKDVMDAIQVLRAKAKSAGTLQSNQQQTVVIDDAGATAQTQAIRIVPADPQVVYVPQYNPQVVYIDSDDDDDDYYAAAAGSAAIGFTAGLAMGAWLDMDCDWHGYGVAYCRPGYWGGCGYAHRGAAVAWGNDWAAAVGPRRAGVVGEHGGAYVGPRGAAVWGENGRGAAWSRGSAAARPYYGNRYSNYGVRTNSSVGANRAARTPNYRPSNVTGNVDRGYSNAARPTNPRTGTVGNTGAQNRPSYYGSNRGSAGNRSAFTPSGNSLNARQATDRGAYSRQPYSGSSANRPSMQSPGSSARSPQRTANVQRSPSRSSGGSSAFRSGGSSPSRQSSSRGSTSRGGGSRGAGRGGGRR